MDHTRQRPEGYTQVVAGVAPTLRPANRQYPQIAADLGYTPPSFNAFDRVTDIDTPLRSYQDLGGASLTIDWKLGPGRLTSTTAWRYWDWNPSNDRDFIGLPVTTISAGTSKQRQWTQEIRYAGDVSPRLNFVVGAFAFRQAIDSDPVIKQEQGAAAARFLLAPTASRGDARPARRIRLQPVPSTYRNVSAALFGQLEWSVTDRLRLLPGLRFNYDQKDVDFDQQVYGGLQTTNPALIALQRSILAPQAYAADVDDTNLSGQMTAGLQGRHERQHLCDLCDQLQVGRPQPERRAHRRAGPARPLRRDRQARGRAPHRGRGEDRAASAASRRTSPSLTPRSRTSRRRS